MASEIGERLKRLRNSLLQEKLQACIIPSSDPHQSEYLAECWKFREYLSGFTGSAGTLVIGLDKAGLWTDSRYFLQAATELEGSGIELFKLAIPGTPALEEWIAVQHYKAVGIDGSLFSTSEALRLADFFSKKGIQLANNFKPYATVWPDRPAQPKGKLMVFPETFNGESVTSKLERLRSILSSNEADCMTVASLDDIAWLMNVRGSDVDFNPVAMAYVFVSQERCLLFIDPTKITDEAREHFAGSNVELAAYDDFASFIEQLEKVRILFDKDRNNFGTYQRLSPSCSIIEKRVPVADMKAIKNATEIAGFREAMIKDGVALAKLFKWIEEVTGPDKTSKEPWPDEWTIGEKAAALRKEQGQYVCESFAPIVSFREHGAIVHYEAERDHCYTVSGEGVLLMDLGAHFLNGSTDVTRTIYLNGTPPPQYKEDYTCLLKGVIALTKAIFPEGTRGSQLDILARQFIWERGLNFLHGTGHGIGHCLYVHEGPQSIRMNENPVTINPGMVMSNEPGVYRAGAYGVRIENAIHVIEKGTYEAGRFFTFETLTLVPFDLNSINRTLLTKDETDWINAYHQKVYEELSPRLNNEECAWLKKKTAKI